MVKRWSGPRTCSAAAAVSSLVVDAGRALRALLEDDVAGGEVGDGGDDVLAEVGVAQEGPEQAGDLARRHPAVVDRGDSHRHGRGRRGQREGHALGRRYGGRARSSGSGAGGVVPLPNQRSPRSHW